MVLWGHNYKVGYYQLDSFISSYPELSFKLNFDGENSNS